MLLLTAAVLVASVSSQVGVDSPTVAGITKRVFQLEGRFDKIPKLAPGQTPNIDELAERIEWSKADFGALAAPIYSQAVGWLHIPESGSYRFRLTSDDGSRMWLNGEVVVRNDGLHGAVAVESAPFRADQRIA